MLSAREPERTNGSASVYPKGGKDLRTSSAIGEKVREMWEKEVAAEEVFHWLLKNHTEQLIQVDQEPRLKLAKSKGRKCRLYPEPFLGAVAILYQGQYSYGEINRSFNEFLGPGRATCQETLRRRMKEVGIEMRDRVESIRTATRKADWTPPCNSSEGSAAAALVQGDATIRLKRRTMLEVVLNTPEEAFARTVGKLLGHHGSLLIRGAEFIKEQYCEWQTTLRLDPSQWGFLMDAKKTHGIPAIVKGEEDIKAYFTMMLACEGCIYCSPAKSTTGRPTTRYIVELYNTDHELLQDIEKAIRQLGYHPRLFPASGADFLHQRRSQKTCYRIVLCRNQEVHRFLEWIGFIPRPYKESLRRAPLRLVRDGLTRWERAGPVYKRISHLRKLSIEISQLRARIDHKRILEEIATGKRPDRRPKKSLLESRSMAAKTLQPALSLGLPEGS